MYRIDNATAVQAIPTPPTPGTPGYFTNGNPNLAQPATIVDDWWLNQLQEEVIAVIAAAGITLNKNNRHQLLDALNSMFTGTGVVGGYLPLIGGTLRRTGGGENILAISTEANRDNHILMQVDGRPQWGIGVAGATGHFRIYNYTAGRNVLGISATDYSVNLNYGDLSLNRDEPLHWIWRNGGTGIAFGRPGGANMPEIRLQADNVYSNGAHTALRLIGYSPGAPDPLYLRSDNNQNCMIHFQLAGAHEYGVGTATDGSLMVYDFTNAHPSLRVRPDGLVEIPFTAIIGGETVATGEIRALTGIDSQGPIVSQSKVMVLAGRNVALGPLISAQNGFGFRSDGNSIVFNQVNIDGDPIIDFGKWNSVNFEILAGNAWKPGGGPWSDNSDSRLKKHVEPYSAGLEQICRLRPVSYQFNGLAGTPDDDKTYYGFLAQEVEPIMPEMIGRRSVRLNPDDAEESEILTLDGTALIYALCNAVVELSAKIDELKGTRA